MKIKKKNFTIFYKKRKCQTPYKKVVMKQNYHNFLCLDGARDTKIADIESILSAQCYRQNTNTSGKKITKNKCSHTLTRYQQFLSAEICNVALNIIIVFIPLYALNILHDKG